MLKISHSTFTVIPAFLNSVLSTSALELSLYFNRDAPEICEVPEAKTAKIAKAGIKSGQSTALKSKALISDFSTNKTLSFQ